MAKGRPLIWTDDELIRILLDIKKRFPDIKITKSLLEKESGIGRNTWQRRMEVEIEKINIRNINHKFNNNNINFPDIETIYRMTKNNPNEFINELLKFEGIILDQHRELEELRKYKNLYKKNLEDKEILNEQFEKSKVQALFYKSAYTALMASSSYSYLQDVDGSIIKEHGIKESLIKMNTDLKSNLSLIQMNKFFDDIESFKNVESQKVKNREIIKNEFDL